MNQNTDKGKQHFAKPDEVEPTKPKQELLEDRLKKEKAIKESKIKLAQAIDELKDK